MKKIRFSIFLSLFVGLMILGQSCTQKINENQKEQTPIDQPSTSEAPKDYTPPAVPKAKDDLSKDCYEPVENAENLPCPDLYAPICGCDGRNYSNPCQAKRAGIKKWTEGKCK